MFELDNGISNSVPEEKEHTLPEVVIPEKIKEERAAGIHNLIQHPPAVDCLHVLGRSGTLAAIGIYDDPALVKELGLPPMYAIDGIGNEVFLEWKNMMREEERDDEIPDEGIGEYADDGIRRPFNVWVMKGASPHVQATISRLRAIPAQLRRIAIMDDMKQSGSVTLGVAPALYKAAYGDDFQYNPGDNRYIFESADWLGQIVRATFGNELNIRQVKFLVELAKGDSDWPGFVQLNPADIHSLDQIAHHMANEYLGYEAKAIPPETVHSLIQKYGQGLFTLHEGVKSALRRHSQEVLLEK